MKHIRGACEGHVKSVSCFFLPFNRQLNSDTHVPFSKIRSVFSPPSSSYPRWLSPSQLPAASGPAHSLSTESRVGGSGNCSFHTLCSRDEFSLEGSGRGHFPCGLIPDGLLYFWAGLLFVTHFLTATNSWPSM